MVASGHAATSAAAATVLRAGGNAFDAAVAAGFAAAVAEPCLTSPGGGGFLLARTSAGEEVLVDCFVAAPGLGLPGPADPADLVRVPVHFGHAVQDFHVGPAAVATPGLLAGSLHVHERLGRLGLDRIVAPAVALARNGVVVDPFGARLLELLEPIVGRTTTGRSLFFRDERVLQVGDRFTNEPLASFLEDVGAGRIHGFRSGDLGGAVTDHDLAAYRVVEREPSRVRYRGAEVLTNPAPSFGGRLVTHALGLLADGPPVGRADDPQEMTRVAEALVALAGHRATLGPGSSRGTTHLSVADVEGNVAAMTSSNGSGSGWFAGDTGVQLNNVMGEEDLHPDGFGSARPGARIGSMMAPSIVEFPDGRIAAFGSGGSERIRSALTQVVLGVVDRRWPLRGAVDAPRMHWDGTRLQVEPGLSPSVLDALAGRWPVNEWPVRDLYFGGAHGVELPGEAVGDPRRGGVGLVVTG